MITAVIGLSLQDTLLQQSQQDMHPRIRRVLLAHQQQQKQQEQQGLQCSREQRTSQEQENTRQRPGYVTAAGAVHRWLPAVNRRGPNPLLYEKLLKRLAQHRRGEKVLQKEVAALRRL